MKKILACSVLFCAMSCAGTRSTETHYTTHAEAFNFLSIPLFGNDYGRAWSKVPEGATVHSVTSTPRDWTSLGGLINRLFGISSTQISWSDPVEEVPLEEDLFFIPTGK